MPNTPSIDPLHQWDKGQIILATLILTMSATMAPSVKYHVLVFPATEVANTSRSTKRIDKVTASRKAWETSLSARTLETLVRVLDPTDV